MILELIKNNNYETILNGQNYTARGNKNKNGGRFPCSKVNISLELFNDANQIDRLIDSIEKNLITFPEMISLLEFISSHEKAILG